MTKGGPTGYTAPVPSHTIVQSSRSRCQDEYGLEPSLRRPIERVPESRIKLLLEPMAEIIAESQASLQRLRQVAKDANYCVLVCDPTGVCVESYADSSESRRLAAEGLTTGSRWNERAVGTNGVGTSIVSRQSVLVCGRAHFNEQFKTYTCSASPIFAPDGSILGVLDISGRAVEASGEHSFAFHIVREAAAAISTQIFRRIHQNDCIVALSSEPEALPLALNALIATDHSGKILGATMPALAFLRVPELSDLGGMTLEELWKVSLLDLKPLATHNVRLDIGDGAKFFVTAFLPNEKTAKSTRAPASHGKASAKAAKQNYFNLDDVAGQDTRMRHNVSLCRKLLDRDIPLLLIGETGVGKDTFARAIHGESSRRNKPYIAVNCAAIPDSLLASELFGYAPGTFTGGLKTGRVGRVVASNNGTLFLDEIGDMPIELQAHLLRVLEEREVTPLGASDPIPVDVRIICATHQDLPNRVERGLFRRDLYYRIKGAQLVIPPLRQRDDIDQLVQRLFDEDRNGRDPVAISEDVQDLFSLYAWPGNVRELRNVIRWIQSVHGDQCQITLEHLPEELLSWMRSQTAVTPTVASVPAATTGSVTLASATLGGAFEELERQKIVDVLKQVRWSITNAAVVLGISRATLHRKIRKYGIVSPNQQL